MAFKTTWKNISQALQDLQNKASCAETSPARSAVHWHSIFMFMAEQCKREQTAVINRNVKEICNHINAMQILHEVLLSLTLTEAARRSWSERKYDERLSRQTEYVAAQNDEERRQVLLALLKFLYCMSSTDIARTEFFQNGFLIPLYSIALAPLCMCFLPKVTQQTRNVKHLSNCQKNCAETQHFIAQDDSGDIRFHATNILCNMCYCDPLKELIGGIAGATRVRALVAIAEYALLNKQFRIVTAASAALRNLTSKRINTRILGALQMYGRLLQLLRSSLNSYETRPDCTDIAASLENIFVIFLNASKSVRAVDCMTIQTNKIFHTLSEVGEKLKNGDVLYKKFEENCDHAAAKREKNEYDSSDEGSLQAEDLIENGDLSSIGNDHSAADATDTSAYETTKNPAKQVQTHKASLETRKPRQLLAEDERLLESAQVFVNEQNIDTTSAASVMGANLRIESIVPHFDFASIKFGKKIGKGTYSIVYCANYCGFQMAAKIINTPLPESAIAREKMLLEFRLMAMLRHPNVVQLMGFSCSPKSNQLIVCTEFCARGSLKDNLEKVADMSIRIKFARDIIAGLYWLHSNFIIHRDLKPANLLVRDDYSVVVADFGLSLYIGSSKEKRPLSRHFKGNVKYSAPEILQLRSIKNGQRGRQFYQYSFASDVYSFSLILWEILSPEPERKLFSQIKSGRTGITEFVVSGGRPKHGVGWPASLCMLLNRCWHADPHQRPTFDRIQQQFDATVVDFMCPDLLGRVMARNLWQGNETQEIKFADFERELELSAGVNLHQIAKGADYRHCLQFMLCENFFQRPVITFERFCNMTHYFGPMSPMEPFLENLLRLFKQPWFFGFIRTEEANTLLAHTLQENRTAQGYYLMRFSCTHKGSFVLHMITHDGKLMHRSIAHQYGSKYTASLDEVHSSEYDSLFSLIRDCNQCDTCLKGMQPIMTSPFLKYFKTYQIASVARNRSSDSGERNLSKKVETTVSTKKAPTAAAGPPTTTGAAVATAPTTTAAQTPRVVIRQPHVTPMPNPVPVQTSVKFQAKEIASVAAAPATVVERHLAGKTISLVSAAKTASNTAASANKTNGNSRWRSSMSSNTTSGQKKSKTKNSDLLKFL